MSSATRLALASRVLTKGSIMTFDETTATARRPHRADVAVIGSGVAGLSAAIEAAESGARVVVIESADAIGGTASGAGGGTCIAGSPLQERLGIVDSVDAALEDWIAWGGDTVDVAWAASYLEASTPVLFERMSEAGVRWIAVHAHEGNRVPRWHQPEGGGKRVMALRAAHAQALDRISWLFGHRAGELVVAGGQITGVTARAEERTVEVVAPAVVVASGGFNNNEELVAAHARAAAGAERILLGGGVGAQGDGIGLLRAVGARFTELDAVWMYPYGTPDPRRPESRRGLAVRDLDGELWINDEGARFHDESRRGGASGTPALLAQPNGRAWSVFDAEVAARMTIADPFYLDGGVPIRERVTSFLASSPHVVSALTLAELAARMDVDSGALRASVAEVNAAIVRGDTHDPAFGKPLAGIRTMDRPPYYAVRFHPLARKNLGGVRTDLSGRVLDEDDRPIDGLFAAGEVAGMAGGRINGRAALEGTAFGPSMFSGIVAGRSAAG